MYGEKNPSSDRAVYFHFQCRQPQLKACRDFIYVPEFRQLHPLSRYHGNYLFATVLHCNLFKRNTGYFLGFSRVKFNFCLFGMALQL